MVFAIAAVASFSVQAADLNVERGKYLVTVMSCTDCHTPGALLGKPDTKRNLGGSEVGFALPDLGVFYGANLTPDKATGLGNWTIDEIAGAIRTGKHPDGRKLAPVMPVSSCRHLTPADALAIAAYLNRSLIRLSTSADGVPMTQDVLRNPDELTVAELDAVASGFLFPFSLFLPSSFGNESTSAPVGNYGHEVAAVPTRSGSAVFVRGHGNGKGNFTNGNGQGNGVGNVFF